MSWRLGGVAGSQLGVPVAAAVDGELGDAAAAHLGEEDLAVGHVFAVLLVAADELGDEAGHGRDRADDRRVGAVGHEALDPGVEGVAALELEAPQRRVAVEEDVVGEHVADVGGAEHVGETFAELLGDGRRRGRSTSSRSCRLLLPGSSALA